jgi:hypothetical protein
MTLTACKNEFTSSGLVSFILSSVDSEQGDQIGRIFAQWAIIYSGQFFSKITELAQKFVLPTFRHSIDYVLSFTKMGWATFWAIFFTNTDSERVSTRAH